MCPEQKKLMPLSDWTMGPRGRSAMDLTSTLLLSWSGWPRPEGRHFGVKWGRTAGDCCLVWHWRPSAYGLVATQRDKTLLLGVGPRSKASSQVHSCLLVMLPHRSAEFLWALAH